jgi:hypothetical protein
LRSQFPDKALIFCFKKSLKNPFAKSSYPPPSLPPFSASHSAKRESPNDGKIVVLAALVLKTLKS